MIRAETRVGPAVIWAQGPDRDQALVNLMVWADRLGLDLAQGRVEIHLTEVAATEEGR